MSANPHLKAAACLLVLALAGCGEDRQRTEARALIALYERIDHREPAAQRAPKVKKLSELTLVDPVVVKARDECVAAHEALLKAERQNEVVSKSLDDALRTDDAGAPLSADAFSKLQDTLSESNAALSDAKTKFESCESQVLSLSLRFGKK